MRRRWGALLALGLLAAPGCDRGVVEPAVPAAAGEPQVVVVDWLGRGRLYAAKITGTREGLTGVTYADGDREWVEASRLRPWPDLRGRRLQVWMRGSAQDVTVIETRGSLLHIRFEDGAHTWASVDMIYALDTGAPGRAPPPDPPSGEAPSFPIRAPVDPARVRPGLHALTHWVNDSGVQRAQPWLVEILGVDRGDDGETVRVRYLSDGTEGSIRMEHVLRIFDEPARPAVGQRVFVAGSAAAGIVREERAGLVKIAAGEEERWVEASDVLAAVPAIDPASLRSGALVTALWNGTSLYHATVQSVAGDQVMLAWHDGSSPSAVPVSDIVEIWQPAS